MSEIDLVRQELELKGKAQTELEYARSLRIENSADMVLATETVRSYKSQIAMVRDIFKKPRELAWQTHRELKAREDALVAGFEEAARIIQRAMLGYTTEQREREAEAQRLAEEARMKQDEAAMDLSTLGKDAPETEEIAIEPIVENAIPEAIKGVYTQQRWTFEIENIAKIPKQFAGVPLFTLDEKAVRKLIDGGVRKIPGIKIYQTEQLIVRKG